MNKIKYYIAIARPEHWTKNAFILPGVLIALLFVPIPISHVFPPLLLTIIAACLVSSANYTINEWLDADFDKFHPIKKDRPSVVADLNPAVVWTQYVVLGAIGLAFAWLASFYVFVATLALFVQGFLYNVRPFRTKDRFLLDVVSESINNPIRLLMGWFAVTSSPLPPASVLIGYWMFGAFLMDIKRYAELRFIGDTKTAALYRLSFKHYTEKSLLVLAVFYGMCSGFFFAIFMYKHRLELLLTFPFVALFYSWYLYIGMKDESPARNPESLPKYEKGFMLYLVVLFLFVILLLYVDVPALEWFEGDLHFQRLSSHLLR